MIVGADIGGTKIAVAGFEPRSGGGVTRTTDVVTVATPAKEGGAAVVRAVADAVAYVRGSAFLEALGIGTAGVVRSDGVISSATDAIADWSGFPVAAEMADAVGAPSVVVNDVHAAGLAESVTGVQAGAEGMLMVAVGTGIGGAVILPGGVRRGATGTAGSIGHIEIELPPSLAQRRCPCGLTGHLESVASGPGMERTYFDETGQSLSMRAVHAASLNGDAVARRVITDGASFLGRALASVNAVLDVGTITIGGGVAELGDDYLAEIAHSYRAAAMPGPAHAKVVRARLGVEAAITGAAMLAAAMSSDTD